MRWVTSELSIRLAGISCFLLAAYSIWLGQMTVDGLPAGYRNPVLALELVKDGQDIDQINGAEGGIAIPFVTKQVYKDFGYIVLYVVLFCWLGFLFAIKQAPEKPWLGWLIAACVIVAGVLDVLENRGMLAALKAQGEGTNSLANSIRYPSLGKWALLFVFSCLLGLLLVQYRGVLRLTSLLFFIAALSGLAGVVLNLVRPRFYVMFPVAILCLGLGLLSIAIVCTFWPHRVLTG